MWKKLNIGSKCENGICFYEVIFDEHDDLDDFCDVLAEYIINKYQTELINYILHRDYHYLTSSELKIVLKNANKLYTIDYTNINKLYIKERLIEYIESSDIIILDGFIMFRLEEYLESLEHIIDKSVEILVAKKEYDEFIELLKFFVDVQYSIVDTIHVIKVGCKYIMLDDKYNEIADDCIDDFLNEMRQGTINYDDLLLSALITLAPKKIYIHQNNKFDNKELMSTLKKVFQNKLHFCNQCELCNSLNKSSQINLNYEFRSSLAENPYLSMIKSDL